MVVEKLAGGKQLSCVLPCGVCSSFASSRLSHPHLHSRTDGSLYFRPRVDLQIYRPSLYGLLFTLSVRPEVTTGLAKHSEALLRGIRSIFSSLLSLLFSVPLSLSLSFSHYRCSEGCGASLGDVGSQSFSWVCFSNVTHDDYERVS